MKLAVVGTGYVGLVTGVGLAEAGHFVTCIEKDPDKLELLKTGHSPIFEPGLTDMLKNNLRVGRLAFTANHEEGYKGAEVIFIAVGTPENEDGSANLTHVVEAAQSIAELVQQDVIVATKSTVPVGTNDILQNIIDDNKKEGIHIDVASNPEFLREGSAIEDFCHGDRIIIGAKDANTAQKLEALYEPFAIPVFHTDIRSAEMIKYASNAFLATKISFINEIANICERTGADVEKVAQGMGLDQRIGPHFLKAGIGYGGSCFPKDTKALIQIAGNVAYDFELLKGVVNVNRKQQRILLSKLYEAFDSLRGRKIAVLGLAFKPNTDDLRDAASIAITEELIKLGAKIYAYDPIAAENAKTVLHSSIIYTDIIEQALENADAALILTEWNEIRNIDLRLFHTMKNALVLDGRNCFPLKKMKDAHVDYYSIGRQAIRNEKKAGEMW